MPTTSLGITYPCETDPITVPTLGTFASSVESALTSSIAIGESARLPLFARLENVAAQQTLTVNVATSATFDTEWTDRGGFWSIGSPSTIVIPANGSYQVDYTASFNTGNVSTFRMAIVAGGVEASFHKEQTGSIGQIGGSLGLSALLPALTIGTIVSVSLLYTGAATVDVRNEFSIIRVANV